MSSHTAKVLSPAWRARRLLESQPENLEHALIDEIYDVIGEVLGRLGTEATCQVCGMTVWWIATSNRRVPYTRDGTNHTEECKARVRRREG